MNEFKSPYKQLNRKVNTWCKYTKRLDTYGNGCEHNCLYCYARSLLSFRGFWGVPKPANLGEIQYQIKRLNRYNVVRLGGMTDCFQPIENEYHITLETIKLLNKYKIQYLIVTKGKLAIDDKYFEVYDKKLAHFQISFTSTNENVWFENAALPSERIKLIEKLYNNGFDVAIRLSPFIPEFIDYDTLNAIDCNKILIEFLKVSPFIRKSFPINYDDYSLKFGGFNHLELSKKIELINNITGFEMVSIGEYVNEHHRYFTENLNQNKCDCCNLSGVRFEKDNQLNMFENATS